MDACFFTLALIAALAALGMVFARHSSVGRHVWRPRRPYSQATWVLDSPAYLRRQAAKEGRGHE